MTGFLSSIAPRTACCRGMTGLTSSSLCATLRYGGGEEEGGSALTVNGRAGAILPLNSPIPLEFQSVSMLASLGSSESVALSAAPNLFCRRSSFESECLPLSTTVILMSVRSVRQHAYHAKRETRTHREDE